MALLPRPHPVLGPRAAPARPREGLQRGADLADVPLLAVLTVPAAARPGGQACILGQPVRFGQRTGAGLEGAVS